jgi:hypothetical protein
MAAQMALAANMTLVGFLRPSGFNVYSGAQRVLPAHTHPSSHDLGCAGRLAATGALTEA